MELQTISQISKSFNISTRTLRYYEQIGLITPIKKEDFAYRTYDEDTILRLQQIIILRKLRIPLKQIADIIKNGDAIIAIRAFEQNLTEIEDEITALSTIKSVILTLLERLHIQSNALRLLDDACLLEIIDSLTVSKISFKEKKTMDDLRKADEKLNRLTDRDVRIIFLPPMTVASIHVINKTNNEGAETDSSNMLFDFIKTSQLHEVMPGFRHFGFNNPDEPNSGKGHGYERWVTIPDDLELPAPFIKKEFAGGLYAAHMIPMGAFEEWGWLYEWVSNSKHYDFRWGTISDRICGWLEEHLNAPQHYLWSSDEGSLQLDLMIPIIKKEV